MPESFLLLHDMGQMKNMGWGVYVCVVVVCVRVRTHLERWREVLGEEKKHVLVVVAMD